MNRGEHYAVTEVARHETVPIASSFIIPLDGAGSLAVPAVKLWELVIIYGASVPLTFVHADLLELLLLITAYEMRDTLLLNK